MKKRGGVGGKNGQSECEVHCLPSHSTYIAKVCQHRCHWQAFPPPRTQPVGHRDRQYRDNSPCRRTETKHHSEKLVVGRMRKYFGRGGDNSQGYAQWELNSRSTGACHDWCKWRTAGWIGRACVSAPCASCHVRVSDIERRVAPGESLNLFLKVSQYNKSKLNANLRYGYRNWKSKSVVLSRCMLGTVRSVSNSSGCQVPGSPESGCAPSFPSRYQTQKLKMLSFFKLSGGDPRGVIWKENDCQKSISFYKIDFHWI